jgi:Polysaccharide deacetylase
LGMDLVRNTTMQAWVQFFAARGDEVGSHGGWTHNEFGRLVDSQSREKSVAMISRNTQAVSQASGKLVREYSAPNGNHPAWITSWLRERGVLAYYFTGDIGMPPTRSFQDGQQGQPEAWAFPVLSFGKYAAFEEAAAHQVPETDVAAWLKDVADFCANTRSVRLMYFHPPGVAIFRQAFADWMRHTKALVANGSLRWTTMAQHADFSNRRLKTSWSMQADDGTSTSTSTRTTRGSLRLLATNSESLDSMGWLLSTTRYAQPRVLEGPGWVVRDGPFWRIVAGKTKHLVVSTALLPPALDETKTGAPQP